MSAVTVTATTNHFNLVNLAWTWPSGALSCSIWRTESPAFSSNDATGNCLAVVDPDGNFLYKNASLLQAGQGFYCTQTGGGGFSFNENAATPGKQYFYYLAANSASTAEVIPDNGAAGTPGMIALPPTPTGFSAVSPIPGAVALSWDLPDTSQRGALGVVINASQSADMTNPRQVLDELGTQDSGGCVDYPPPSWQTGTIFYQIVFGVAQASLPPVPGLLYENSSAAFCSIDLSGGTAALPALTGLAATSNLGAEVDLTWGGIAQPPMRTTVIGGVTYNYGFSSYVVYRNTTPDFASATALCGPGTADEAHTATTFRDKGVSQGQKYFYWVVSCFVEYGSPTASDLALYFYGAPCTPVPGIAISLPNTLAGITTLPSSVRVSAARTDTETWVLSWSLPAWATVYRVPSSPTPNAQATLSPVSSSYESTLTVSEPDIFSYGQGGVAYYVVLDASNGQGLGPFTFGRATIAYTDPIVAAASANLVLDGGMQYGS